MLKTVRQIGQALVSGNFISPSIGILTFLYSVTFDLDIIPFLSSNISLFGLCYSIPSSLMQMLCLAQIHLRRTLSPVFKKIVRLGFSAWCLSLNSVFILYDVLINTWLLLLIFNIRSLLVQLFFFLQHSEELFIKPETANCPSSQDRIGV